MRSLQRLSSSDEVIRWALIQYNWCHYGKRKYRHRNWYAQREDDGKTHLEHRVHVTGAIHLQTKEHQGFLANTRNQQRPTPRFQNNETTIFSFVDTKFLVLCYGSIEINTLHYCLFLTHSFY